MTIATIGLEMATMAVTPVDTDIKAPIASRMVAIIVGEIETGEIETGEIETGHIETAITGGHTRMRTVAMAATTH